MDPAANKGAAEAQQAMAEATAKTMLPLLQPDNLLFGMHSTEIGNSLRANALHSSARRLSRQPFSLISTY